MGQEENNGHPEKKKSGMTALKVAGGVLAGAAVGGLAGVLLAPDSGKNTRKKIADQAKAKAYDAKMTVREKMDEVKKTVEDKVDEVKKKLKPKKELDKPADA